ncbi:hypothetical protein GCM10017562_74380 [Streptomyces roseofulvus]
MLRPLAKPRHGCGRTTHQDTVEAFPTTRQGTCHHLSYHRCGCRSVHRRRADATGRGLGGLAALADVREGDRLVVGRRDGTTVTYPRDEGGYQNKLVVPSPR